MADKHPGGRPPLWADPKELQEKIDAYFKKCEEHMRTVVTKTGVAIEINDPLIPSIAGMAVELGCDRATIWNYSNKDEFFDTIKKARDYITAKIEEKMLNTDGNIVGTIFTAKNYGYTDRQEITNPDAVKVADIKEIFTDFAKQLKGE